MKPIQTTWLKITGLLLTLGILVAITAISIIDNTIPKMQATTLRLQTLASTPVTTARVFCGNIDWKGA